MILLSGHSLTQVRRIPVETMSLSLKERESSATVTMPSLNGAAIGSLMLDDKDPGKGIVWRVKGIQQSYAQKTPTVTLEHAIQMLRDRILFGAVKPADITGNKKSTSCTAKQAVQYILKQQGDWVLGTFGYSVSNPYKFDGETLYDALVKVSDSLEDARWTYDMSVYPFKLNIKPRTADVVCEMRPGRNLTAITKSVDRSGMYTRFYPIGKNDLHLSGGGYVSKNESKYGVVSKVETDTTLETSAELKAWANERLAKHAQPIVTITADGMDLANATGESLDRLRVGTVCRIPLEEFGETFTERITELKYNDKVHAPEVVQVTLSNEREDVTKVIADAIKRGGGGRRAQARTDSEFESRIDKADNRIALVVEQKNGKDVVKRASIIAAINENNQSTVTIEADKIDLSGYVTVSDLNATNATIDNLMSGTTQATYLNCASLRAVSADIGSGITQVKIKGHAVGFQSVTIGGVAYELLGYKG